ncbi:hypothetical protein [Streptomyces scabiei]|uniref:hypothetical protein n=1 Tax=Streptomyces scabiei TaxID=1930 RepID=UPI001FF0CA44|nr:hypothetical protein [Streptomyces sp. LBUM 1475]
MKIGSWLHRQLTTWAALHPGQQHLLTTLGLTPDTNPLTPAAAPAAPSNRPSSSLDSSSTAKARPHSPRDHPRRRRHRQIGAWLAKARTKHRTGQLPETHACLVAALFDGDWTTEDAVPAVLA